MLVLAREWRVKFSLRVCCAYLPLCESFIGVVLIMFLIEHAVNASFCFFLLSLHGVHLL